jgi:hypothetical protein
MIIFGHSQHHLFHKVINCLLKRSTDKYLVELKDLPNNMHSIMARIQILRDFHADFDYVSEVLN